MSQIVRDEYGRHFYLHNADDAWKISDNTATMEWGTWEPVFSTPANEPKDEEEEEYTVVDEDAKLITEAVIQEANCFIEEINNLTLSADNKEKERLYELLRNVTEAMAEYVSFRQSVRGIE
jgi:hypothetical protein